MDAKLLRDRARANLAGNWAVAIAVAAVACLLGGLMEGTLFLPQLQTRLSARDFESLKHLDFDSIHLKTGNVNHIGLVGFLLGGVIQLGYARFLLKQHDGEPAEFNDLFSQFHRFGQGFAQKFLRSLYTFLWSLLFIIPGIIKGLSYAMTPYLMAENPELGVWIQETFNLQSLDWANIVKDILAWIGNQISSVMGSAVSVIGSVTSGIVNTVIALVFALYCLGRKEILARQGRRILYSILPEKVSDETIRILRLTNSTFSNFISGQCLEAIILGCLFAVAMLILDLPYIPLVSVIIAVTALIPVVGAFVGCVLGAFFILVNDPLQAVTFVVMFLVLQQLENNLIYPRVVGTSIGLPGMWVLVAVTIGGEVMGVAGMLLMIPLASVLYTLAREFTDRRLLVRGIPDEKLRDQPPDIRSGFQRNSERRQRDRMRGMKDKFRMMQEKKKK